MHLFSALTTAAAVLLLPPVGAQSFPPPNTFPSLTYLFAVNTGFNPSAPVGRIPQGLGGATLLEPLIQGRIFGPALNATLTAGGLAYPTQNANGSLALPSLLLQGRSNDNTTDILIAGERIGIGKDGDQWVRLPVNIGGKYAYLQEIFVLAHLQADRQTGAVQVGCWCVGCNESIVKRINGY